MQTSVEGDNLFESHAISDLVFYQKRWEELGQPVRTDLSEVIAENFGANASYVEGLLNRFRSNPELVDESWRTYFSELLGNGDGAAHRAGGERRRSNERRKIHAPPRACKLLLPLKHQPQRPRQPQRQHPSNRALSGSKARPAAPAETIEAKPIRGAALKIVENMEASLSVPTATSQRRIPVKLLDENRQVINDILRRIIAARLHTRTSLPGRCCARWMSFRNSTTALKSLMEFHRAWCGRTLISASLSIWKRKTAPAPARAKYQERKQA